MNWKQEYIDGDQDRIKEFLEQHIGAAGVGAPRVMIVKESSHDFTFYVNAGGARVAKLWLAEKNDGFNQSFEITSLKVEEYFRGRHIGAMLLKAALVFAQAHGSDYLSIYSVNNDGLSFWPRHGSLPKKNPPLDRKIGVFLANHGRFVGNAAKIRLKQIAKDYEREPIAAWRIASQMQECMADGGLVSAALFKIMDTGDDHWLLPGEETTRAILHERLGVIPAFRPPADCFAPQVRALQPLRG